MSFPARLRNWSLWALAALWAVLSAIIYELSQHAIYSAVLDWLKDQYAEETRQILAYASAHVVPVVAAAFICIVFYFLGAFRPRHEHGPANPAHNPVSPPIRPATAAAASAASLTSAKAERAACMKADAEFDRIKREFERSPLSVEDYKRIEDNIHRDYSPHDVLAKAVNIRVETEIIPIFDKMIDYELLIRKQHNLPFPQDRIDSLKQRFRDLIREYWEQVVSASCHDAELHVIENTGYLEDYKRKELRKRESDLLNQSPVVLINIVDQKLQSAMAESILSSSQQSNN